MYIFPGIWPGLAGSGDWLDPSWRPNLAKPELSGSGSVGVFGKTVKGTAVKVLSRAAEAALSGPRRYMRVARENSSNFRDFRVFLIFKNF